jgi:hypothetical protein
MGLMLLLVDESLRRVERRLVKSEEELRGWMRS